MRVPDWLITTLKSEANPKSPENLFFHGTIEPFESELRPTQWEGLLWFSDSPIISQSYCAAAGLSGLWSYQRWRRRDRFVPVSDLDQKLFTAMGYDITKMEITLGRDGIPESYRLVENHPNHENVARYIEFNLGYVLEDDSCWINLKNDQIKPASWKEQGRLYIIEKPNDLKLYDMRSLEGGLTGRQWMETDKFQKAQEAGYDGVIISDVHHTKKLGHFEHTSWGLFGRTIKRLNTHKIPCTFFDPADSWYGEKLKNTPEWLEFIKNLKLETA